MPPRTTWLRALAPLVAIAFLAGCQDYNFNPVGSCLFQPGSERVTLSNISTADVLFVVDDSGSMGGEQGRLATGFQNFITNLDATNQARVQAGLKPIDFHVAITTTSVYFNSPTTAVCRSDCPQAAGQQICCSMSGSTPLNPFRVAKPCPAGTGCGAGTECRTDCSGFAGDKVCCDPGTKVPPATEPITCDTADAPCGRLETHYRFATGCTPGLATNGARYPQGDFVGRGTNPRVLHFDKELYDGTANPRCPGGTCNKQGYTRDQLIAFFEQNAVVGTCGSGQEQALQAGRLAVQKALAGQQLDVVSPAGAPGSFPAEWPHANAKLVVVFLGDEDDCSSPQDPVKGVILSGNPGADTCVADTTKRFPVADFTSYFEGLGRALGAGYIVSTQSDTCVDDACSPGLCCDTACSSAEGFPGQCRTDTCGGQGAGFRLLELRNELKAQGADTVVGSMCNNAFGTILSRIAEIVKPPSGLVLPTVPASELVTVVRIGSGTSTRKTCTGPAPAGTALDAAVATWDWWFTASAEQVTAAQRAPTAASRFIYINLARNNCTANPGETYSAEYVGQLACTVEADCASRYGGVQEDWTCFAGLAADKTCLAPSAANPGSCICGGRARNCPANP